MQKYEQNILTNSGHCSDPVANKVINKGRLGFCQRVVNLFVKFLSRRRYELKQMEREQDKKYILGTCIIFVLVGISLILIG